MQNLINQSQNYELTELHRQNIKDTQLVGNQSNVLKYALVLYLFIKAWSKKSISQRAIILNRDLW